MRCLAGAFEAGVVLMAAVPLGLGGLRPPEGTTLRIGTYRLEDHTV